MSTYIFGSKFLHNTSIFKTTIEDIIEHLTRIIRIKNNRIAELNKPIPLTENNREKTTCNLLIIKVCRFGIQLIEK